MDELCSRSFIRINTWDRSTCMVGWRCKHPSNDEQNVNCKLVLPYIIQKVNIICMYIWDTKFEKI